mmetsp:Transcript_39605/g.104543  ORF Transcript_39605/g.104543 Transcript_39605/m.104543 type:complete len:211 (-) Transcript_39605:17-649(-)
MCAVHCPHATPLWSAGAAAACRAMRFERFLKRLGELRRAYLLGGLHIGLAWSGSLGEQPLRELEVIARGTQSQRRPASRIRALQLGGCEWKQPSCELEVAACTSLQQGGAAELVGLCGGLAEPVQVSGDLEVAAKTRQQEWCVTIRVARPTVRAGGEQRFDHPHAPRLASIVQRRVGVVVGTRGTRTRREQPFEHGLVARCARKVQRRGA